MFLGLSFSGHGVGFPVPSVFSDVCAGAEWTVGCPWFGLPTPVTPPTPAATSPVAISSRNSWGYYCSLLDSWFSVKLSFGFIQRPIFPSGLWIKLNKSWKSLISALLIPHICVITADVLHFMLKSVKHLFQFWGYNRMYSDYSCSFIYLYYTIFWRMLLWLKDAAPASPVVVTHQQLLYS